MIDLKPYFDAARAADDETKRIMADMNAAFTEGTDEGKQRALDLRPALDEAKKKAQDANELYISLRDAAAQDNSAASEFVPVAEHLPAAQADKQMKRDAFLALDASARMKFIMGGGIVLDEDEE